MGLRKDLLFNSKVFLDKSVLNQQPIKMVKIINFSVLLLTFIFGFDASPIFLRKDQLMTDIRYSYDKTKTGALQSNFRWPMGPDGFVIVPFRIQPSEGFSKLMMILYDCKEILIE